MLELITGLFPLVNKIVDRIPDPAAREKAAIEMQAALLTAAVEESKGQAEINKIEAANPNLFVSGWRPACGWIGVAGLAYVFIITPFVNWILLLSGGKVPLPAIDSDALLGLVYSLLGIGAMRSFEKWKGVARK